MRQAAGDDRVVQCAASGDAQTMIVEIGALAPLGEKEIFSRGIVQDGGPRSPDPRARSAIETANCGRPCRKFVVPSSGSTIQVLALSVPSARAAFFADETRSPAVPSLNSSSITSSERLTAAVTKFAGPLERDLQISTSPKSRS